MNDEKGSKIWGDGRDTLLRVRSQMAAQQRGPTACKVVARLQAKLAGTGSALSMATRYYGGKHTPS